MVQVCARNDFGGTKDRTLEERGQEEAFELGGREGAGGYESLVKIN